jgi:SWI/SNF-related matrix-associated actin-dependent regulator of chromatin subfamily A containing DEAD/H box 1
MTARQRSIYNDALQRSRKTICEAEAAGESAVTTNGKSKARKGKPKATTAKYLENSSNVLMDLRKAASHPMLFRTRFTDGTLNGIARQLMKEPEFKKRQAVFELVKEDMEVMTDAELQVFCASYQVCFVRFPWVRSDRSVSLSGNSSNTKSAIWTRAK